MSRGGGGGLRGTACGGEEEIWKEREERERKGEKEEVGGKGGREGKMGCGVGGSREMVEGSEILKVLRRVERWGGRIGRGKGIDW
jgi:hypothetical protein